MLVVTIIDNDRELLHCYYNYVRATQITVHAYVCNIIQNSLAENGNTKIQNMD